MSLILHLQRNSDIPLFRQIVSEVRSLIDNGTLKPGDRLPPSRAFAESLGVDRSTVITAYAELGAQGYVTSRMGGYTTVAKRRSEVAYSADRSGIVDWSQRVSQEVEAVFIQAAAHPSESLFPALWNQAPVYNLASIELDPRLYPLQDVKRCLGDVLAGKGAEMLRYGDPSGYPPLRLLLAKRLRLHGISVSQKEILITNGAQQGLDLISRVLGGPAKCVVVEEPTYASILPLLRLNGMHIVGIPMNKEGADIEALDGVLKKEKPAFIYTMPSFQNPTGLTTSHRHREQLLDLAIKNSVPIVEDGFEDDMKYEGPVAMPVKSIDNEGLVVYVGTFSKALFPGFRVGWIAAERSLIERLAVVKRFTDLGTNTPGQMLLERFCREGFYDRHLQRVHRMFRRRMAAAMDAAQKYFPFRVEWTRPEGGYTIWVKFPLQVSSEDLNRRAMEAGVFVSPGGAYFPETGDSEFVRLSIARLNEEEIVEAFRRLGLVLRNFV